MQIALNKFSRYQTGLTLNQLFPSLNGICACGCEKLLPSKKRKWFSEECVNKSYLHFAVIKGDIAVIRQCLYDIDFGFCRHCGSYSENWQADHIVPVFAGGGACDISNFQTLCVECHADKTLRGELKIQLSKSHSSKLSCQLC